MFSLNSPKDKEKKRNKQKVENVTCSYPELTKAKSDPIVTSSFLREGFKKEKVKKSMEIFIKGEGFHIFFKKGEFKMHF